jgi:putative transposase
MSDLVPFRCEVHTGPIDIDGMLMQINIVGSADLQRNIRLLFNEYIDILSPTVRQKPARVPPLSMEVDIDKWKDKRNRLSPSFLTRDKDADLQKQIALFESLGVIEKSMASEYSQVRLVHKPNNSWRLCIDFKSLNDATESMETWPLQNISIMIDRVTQHRPRLYGKVDMTSGFFQAAIDERSGPFTALIKSTGLFQWCRLPMGLKGAASYFQRMMASKVLVGLLYIFVELYLDDVLVYTTNDDEFFERLRIALERFRQFNIALNPKKCYFGLAEVEFVGHVLKSDGVCFFTEKRSKVLDFPLPVKQKQLKSFLGLINYFRDHVKGLSHKVKPLNDIMIPYRRVVPLIGLLG